MIAVVWNPNVPAALLLLFMIFAMYASDLREYRWNKRFFSDECERLKKISRTMQGRTR
jgi:hypothetical protein